MAQYALYGIGGLVPLAVISTRDFIIWETPKVALLNILTLIALAAWVNKMAWSGRLEIRIPPFFVPVMVYFDVYVLATVFSLSPVLSIFGIYDRSVGLINATNLMALYFLVFNILARREQQVRCLKVIVLSASLVALLGILQYFGTSPAGFLPPMEGQRVGATLGNADYAIAVIILAIPVAVALAVGKGRSAGPGATGRDAYRTGDGPARLAPVATKGSAEAMPKATGRQSAVFKSRNTKWTR